MMLRSGFRYICAYPSAAQRGVGSSVSVHHRLARSLPCTASTSSSCIAVSSSWCRPAAGAATAAVPRRLCGFMSPFAVSHGSNYGVIRLWSSGRPSEDPMESVPLTEGEPKSSSLTKTGADAGKDLEQPVEAPQPQSWRQRGETFVIEYGRVGICTHIVLSLLSFSIIYAGVSSGVDVGSILKSIGFSSSTSDSITNSAGSALIAYTLYKMLAPVRWPLTLAVTPVVLRALRRRGYMLATTNLPSNPPSPPPQ